MSHCVTIDASNNNIFCVDIDGGVNYYLYGCSYQHQCLILWMLASEKISNYVNVGGQGTFLIVWILASGELAFFFGVDLSACDFLCECWCWN